MDKIVMPELVPPVLAEAIAGNPELLKTILEHKPDEEVIVGRDVSLDCSAPANLKLVLCNVTISVKDTDGIQVEGWGPDKLSRRKLETAALEARIRELERIIRVIPRVSENKKLVAWCKKELHNALKALAAKRSEQEEGADEKVEEKAEERAEEGTVEVQA